jgi:hypothetical protein
VSKFHGRGQQQRGQALVAVIVLISLMFLIGTAMTLAVSSSLQTVRQTTNEDWRGYAAESVATRALDRATRTDVDVDGPPCTDFAGTGLPVNGYGVLSSTCYMAQIVPGAPIHRDAVAAQTVNAMGCADPNITITTGREAWGTLAWLPAGPPAPSLSVFLGGVGPCPSSGGTPCSMSIPKNPIQVYFFTCASDGGGGVARPLHVRVAGKALLRAFYVRSADAVTDPEAEADCAVTGIGSIEPRRARAEGGALAEGDLVMPDCKRLTAAPATPFWNRLLP